MQLQNKLNGLLLVLCALLGASHCQMATAAPGAIQQTIYQFLKSQSSRFIDFVDRIGSTTGDKSLAMNLDNQLQGSAAISPNGFTVFVPNNDAFTGINGNSNEELFNIKNDLSNLVVRDRLTLDRLRELSGKNISMTLGNKPRLFVRVVKNFYQRPLKPSGAAGVNSPKYVNPQAAQQPSNPQLGRLDDPRYPSDQMPPYSPPVANNYPNANTNNRDMNNTNIYGQFGYLYQGSNQAQYSGPAISLEFPQDELFIVNNAVVLEKYELANGIVYMMNAYPRFYDKSLWDLLKGGDIPALSQNLNWWVSKTTELRIEVMKNALSAYSSNTFFLTSDAGIAKYADRDKLNNVTFLYDIIFKSHRISEQIVFDYYLDGPQTFYTDSRLPVNTYRRRLAGSNVDDIDISIGHVKGKINPELRNIYCASGIVHVIDTILGVPSRSAFAEISQMAELATFRQLIERSAKYRQMLDQVPSQTIYPTAPPFKNSMLNKKRQLYGATTSDNVKMVTVLAPREVALLNIKDYLMQNETALDHFLSSHIIVDNDQNRVFYTEHDESVFTNGQTYTTYNPMVRLQATVEQNALQNTRVVLNVAGRASLKAEIIKGDIRSSNGVIHTIDNVLVEYLNPNIIDVLDKYTSANIAGAPAISQFLETMKSTGVYNELRSSNKQYTLFIPTNEAFMKYLTMLNSPDANTKKQVIYRHLCESNILTSDLDQYGSQYQQNQNPNQNYQNYQNSPSQNQNNAGTRTTLTCRNALGQELKFFKDNYGTIVQLEGVASARISQNINGQFSSAYVVDTPILNGMQPAYALHYYNSACRFFTPSSLIAILISALVISLRLY